MKKMAALKLISSGSLLDASNESINSMDIDEDTKTHIKSLRDLYGMQDKLQNMLNEIKSTNLDKDKLANINIQRFVTKNVDEGFFIGLFRRANKYQLTDVTDVLMVDIKSSANPELIADIDVCLEREESAFCNINNMRGLIDPANRFDASKASTVANKSISSAVVPAPTAALNLDKVDDHEMVNLLIKKAKGPIIIESEAMRKKLIESASQVLSDQQKEHLQPQHILFGLYKITEEDRSLTVAVKYMHNAMLTFEALMHLVNKLQKIFNGSYFSYHKIPQLLLSIKETVIKLLEQIKLTNDALLLLRMHLENTVLTVGENNILTMFADITQKLPLQLNLLSNDIQVKLVDAIGNKGKSHFTMMDAIEKLSIESNRLNVQSEELKKSISIKPEVEIVEVAENISVQKMIEPFKKYLLRLKTNDDGSYDLSQFKDKPKEKCIAALVNASYKVASALDATEQYAKGSPITGLFGVLKNLYSAWSLINEVDAFKQVDTLKEEYNQLKTYLNNQIKDHLTKLIPFIKKLMAQAAFSEKILGLNENIIFNKINVFIDQYITLGTSYGIAEISHLKLGYPYIDIQHELAEQEQSNLQDIKKQKILTNADLINFQETYVNDTKQTLETLMQQDLNKSQSIKQQIVPAIATDPKSILSNKLDARKVRKLAIACDDYKHHLAESLNIQLEKICPDKSQVDLNCRFNADTTINLKKHPNLKLTIDKFNAVHDLQTSLTSADNNENKLSLFSAQLKNNKPLFSKIRNTDKPGITFLKVIASIFTAGLAAAFGIWKSTGEKKTERMEEVLKFKSK